MSKININATKIRRVLAAFGLGALTLTIASCSPKDVGTLDKNSNYLTIGDYNVTTGEVWDELKWNASSLFDDKKKEAALQSYLNDIKDVMSNKNSDKYNEYKARIQNYLIEEVYSFEFSLEDHEDELKDLDDKTKTKAIAKYADQIVLNNPVELSVDDIKECLTNDDFDGLEKIYHLYYIDLAAELLAKDKLNEEIAEKNEEDAKDDDEDTIGYFSKSEVVDRYKSEYLHQGDVETILIRFASETEANDTLRAFGIKINEGKYYYLITPSYVKSFSEYKRYYDKFSFSDYDPNDVIDLSSLYGDSFILQMYIAMYNYVYTYRQAFENIDFNPRVQLDQREATIDLIKTYNSQSFVTDAETDDARINAIVSAIKNDATTYNDYVTYTAEEITEINSSLYTYIYDTLSTPITEDDTNSVGVVDGDYTRYSTSPYSVGSYYYMAFKISQAKDADRYDDIYDDELTTDELYDKIVENENLYNLIIQDLTNEDVTSTYITEKLDAEVADVKVKIFDEAIEISYASTNTDYNKTLSGAPDNNTLAEFTYNNNKTYAYLSTEDKTGLYDILEYRQGSTTAIQLIANKIIKDSDAYKNIDQEDIDIYYQTVEYMLAIFANDGLAQSGYPATLGKYNFLMLYYHTSDIDKIVQDRFMVSNASTQLIVNYTDDYLLGNVFKTYADKAYDNYFSVNATELQVFIDIDEDGEPDENSNWTEEQIRLKTELIQKVYQLLESDTADHKTALGNIVTNYNSSGRFNNHDGEQGSTTPDYDPTGNEWDFSKFKKAGLAISTSDITATNTSTDIDDKVLTFLKDYYAKNKDKEVINTQYLFAATEENILNVENTYRYYLVTGITKPSSAKYEEKNDEYGLYKDVNYMYNNKLEVVSNLYNNNDKFEINQIKGYLLEYSDSQTSALLPSDISTAITDFLSPIYTRFTSTATQNEIVINFICGNDESKIQFANDNDGAKKAHFNFIREANKRISDDYIDDSRDEGFNNFAGWWTAIENLKLGGNA